MQNRGSDRMLLSSAVDALIQPHIDGMGTHGFNLRVSASSATLEVLVTL